MNDDLVRRSVHLGRFRVAFAILSGLAAVCLAVSLVSIIVMLAGDHLLLEPAFIDDEVLFPVGELWIFDLGLLLAGGFLIPVVIVWLAWLFTASRFARKAGAQGMRYPAWVAVICHFFPVVSLYMPLLILVELEAATREPNGWQNQTSSRLAATTWLVAKSAAFGFVLSLNLRGEAETAAEYIESLIAIFIAGLLCAIGLLLAYRMMCHMHRLQENLAQRTASPPLPDQI